MSLFYWTTLRKPNRAEALRFESNPVWPLCVSCTLSCTDSDACVRGCSQEFVQVIGVNNRNLHTFEVDMGTTERLARMIPLGADVLLAALSGIASRAKSSTPDHRSQPTASATPSASAE